MSAYRLRGQIELLRGVGGLRHNAPISRALEDLSHALTLDPGDVVSRYSRVLCREVPALERLESAQALRERGKAKAHGLVSAAEGELERACEEYTKLLALQHANPHFHFHRGICRSRLGDLEGALADLVLVGELGAGAFRCGPQVATIHLGRALVERSHIHTALGEGMDALRELEGAVRLFVGEDARDELTAARRLLAGLAFRLGEHGTVIEAISSLEGDARDAEVLLQRGLSYFELESFELARADASRILSANPNDHGARYLRGRCAAKLASFQSAMADLDRCVEIRPEDRECRAWRAWVNAQAGRADRALDDAKAAGDHPLALLALGRAHRDRGAHQDAQKALEQALTAGADGAEELLKQWYR